MPGNLEQIRKPPHNKTFGIEIEMIFDSRRAPVYGHRGFWFIDSDGSIRPRDWDSEGRECVSQPMPYEMLLKQIDKLHKRIGNWSHNASCGIHIHVSRQWLSETKAIAIRKGLQTMTHRQIEELFGRGPNDYCDPYYDGRYNSVNTQNSNTIEFRMFRSGDHNWAKECVRRANILVNHKGNYTYRELMEEFTNP